MVDSVSSRCGGETRRKVCIISSCVWEREEKVGLKGKEK